MLFESVLMLIAFGIAVFLIGIPLIKLVKVLVPQKKDPLRDAKVRLEIAHKETEAARLNKETEKLYQEMYDDIITDDPQEPKGKLRL